MSGVLLRISGGAVVAFILLLVNTGSALGAATTENRTWHSGTTEGGVSVLAGSEEVTAEIATNPSVGKTFIIKTKISGTTIELAATGISCVSCTIFNEGGGARGRGKTRFTGVTVKTPSTCKVKEGAIMTNELTVDATYMEGSKPLRLITPTTGEAFATVTLEKGTGTCAITGSYIVKGSIFSEGTLATGVYKTEQPSTFSPSINSAAGGALKFGAEPAELTGSVILKDGGKYFGVG